MPLSCVMLLEGRRPVGNIAQLRGIIFTVLHVMQTRYSNENSVCLPVRLSVCHSTVATRVYFDKTEERSVQIFIPYER